MSLRSTDEPAALRRDPSRKRLRTAHLRQPPDFLIIGAQKGGTTSLYRYLTAHPDVGAALRKEVLFFDRSYHKGMEWYLANFPLRDEARMVGEATPNYLFHPDVPGRVRAALPGVKLIALLRNPVDRAYSQHQMNVRKGFEPLPFEEAIAVEPERLTGRDRLSQEWRLFSYLSRGLYAEQLQRWLDLFPREQLLVIKSEDLFEAPEATFLQTLGFLGLRPHRLAGYEVYQGSGYAGLPMATRRQLATHFAPHNRRLYDVLGRDLGWDDG